MALGLNSSSVAGLTSFIDGSFLKALMSFDKLPVVAQGYDGCGRMTLRQAQGERSLVNVKNSNSARGEPVEPYECKAQKISDENNQVVTADNNKETEAYFARKNFWSKIKNCYLVVKIAATIVIIAMIYYLYAFLSGWFANSPVGPLGMVAESKDIIDVNQQPKESGPPLGGEQKTVGPVEVEQPVVTFNQPAEILHAAREVVCQLATGAQKVSLLPPTGKRTYLYDCALAKKVMAQFEYAGGINLHPEAVHLEIDPVDAQRYARGGHTFLELLKQQVDYAKSIGLEPAVMFDLS